MNKAKTLGLYFSGTGNTKYCITKFIKHFDEKGTVISIENSDVIKTIKEHDFIIFGHPIYFSNIPKFVRDFLTTNKNIFKNKKVFIVCTMGLFSGDGAGCSARIFKKMGAKVVGGLHLKMPDCIGDVKLLKRSSEKNKELIDSAQKKIQKSVQKLKNGKPTKDGLSFFHHIAGLFGQRLWFYGKAMSYKEKPKTDTEKCIGCGRCASVCPLKNIEVKNGKAVSKGKCTLCYRCFGNCPSGALTILGKKVHEQYLFEKNKKE